MDYEVLSNISRLICPTFRLGWLTDGVVASPDPILEGTPEGS